MDDKMAVKFHMCMLGLMLLCSLLTGPSEADTHVFCSSGENVCLLLCNNALSDCTSTTWTFNRQKESKTDELISSGIKKNDTERHERLSLGSNCSLSIKKVTKEDYGFYTCRQYANGKQQGTDARVYLHVLQVFLSSSQTEIRPGNSVILSCQLYHDRVSCDTLVRTEDIVLIWVNQAGVTLQTDTRYQISPPGECISTLNTTLLNEDHNREWRCQVTQRNIMKTLATYTFKDSVDTNSEDPPTTNTQVITISAVAAAIAVVIVAVLCVICKKNADNERGTDRYVVKDSNEHKGTYETISMSIPTMPKANASEQDDSKLHYKEQRDEVIYSEVTASSKKQVHVDFNHSNDTVTYAAIRGTEYAPQDGLYASVNNNNPPTNKH